MRRSSRIRAGAYDGYTADLCIDDPDACKSADFAPYKTDGPSDTGYQIKVDRAAWPSLPPDVRSAVVWEITWFTWGISPNRIRHWTFGYGTWRARLRSTGSRPMPRGVISGSARATRSSAAWGGTPTALTAGTARSRRSPTGGRTTPVKRAR